MNVREAVVVALLAFGVGVELLCCAGVLTMPSVYARLHYVGPASTVGGVAIVAAVIVAEGGTHNALKALLVAAVLIAAGPVLTHATARAVRIRDYGRWRVLPGEEENSE